LLTEQSETEWLYLLCIVIKNEWLYSRNRLKKQVTKIKATFQYSLPVLKIHSYIYYRFSVLAANIGMQPYLSKQTKSSYGCYGNFRNVLYVFNATPR